MEIISWLILIGAIILFVVLCAFFIVLNLCFKEAIWGAIYERTESRNDKDIQDK